MKMDMLVRSIKVDRKDIGYIRWCLESHDGIANPTTRDGHNNIIDLTIAPDFIADAEDLINALVEELGVEKIESPERSPFL
ncbi:MAG: DUF4911 domain-containing protein [Deltaproteobacteria bacterium]|nr:DUF4911 domain-containing protein [Deltaproteobacteria bacterium]